MTDNLTLEHLTEQEVSRIFANPESEAAQRWMRYWASTEARNAELLAQFQQVVSLGFDGRTVLDIGCGSAGLATAVAGGGGHYFGADYSPYVLKMGQRWLRQKGLRADLMRASGSELPFRDENFDYVFALDVIEHLERGRSQQLRFLKELRRVVRPMGMIFLSTPNKWYPFEGHTFLYLPQYLPAILADRYIMRKNPGFLQEHGSFRAIKLLPPKELERLLDLSGLAFLHQLPCSRDIEDLPPARRLAYRLLSVAGLAWYPMQEFWGCLVRKEHRETLRLKCAKYHVIALRESAGPTLEFAPQIDFSRGPEAPQLKQGWFPHETGESGFRWTGEKAELWLQAAGEEDFLSVSGYCVASSRAQFVTLSLFCDDCCIGRHRLEGNKAFHLRLLLPYRLYRSQICAIRLAVDPCHVPGGSDHRRLGVAVSRVAFAALRKFSSCVDFSRGPESEALRNGWFPHEGERSGFRWTTDQAELGLPTRGDENFLVVSGYCNASERPAPVILRIYFDNRRIGEHRMEQNETFDLWWPLPYRIYRSQVCTVRLVTEPCYIPGGSDQRKLGVTLSRVGLL